MKKKNNIRESVKKAYDSVVSQRAGNAPSKPSFYIGYSEEQLASIPESADLGLGCGNPVALAGIGENEHVVDLGSGAGIDVFIAAEKVGSGGRVIGVDMTPSMLASARNAATESGVSAWVEFREGDIENLPIVSESIDIVLSNCVINLSSDKSKAFSEAFRILKPGGRLSMSDLCLTAEVDKEIRDSAHAYLGCVSNIVYFEEYLSMLTDCGFTDIEWVSKSAEMMFAGFSSDPLFESLKQSVGEDALKNAAKSVSSYQINARRPHDQPSA